MCSASGVDGPSPADCKLFALITDNARIPHQKEVISSLASLRPHMDLLVGQSLTLPTWTPPRDVASHFEDRAKFYLQKLKLPCVDRKPSMLLHRLGEEPELRQRVKDVFGPTDTILINTSGSGKTRLLLEGLCQHWGFYFTSHVGSSVLGSHNIQNTIEKTIPHEPKLFPVLRSTTSTDERVAIRAFKRVFLARVLILGLFIEVIKEGSGPKNDFNIGGHKRNWLFLQLQPSLLSPEISDPFENLTQKLLASAYSDANLHKMTKNVLRRIQNALERASTSSDDMHLYCVIDEVQFAAMEHTIHFRSTNGIPRPIIRPLIQTLTHYNVFIVLAGTGLPSSLELESRFRKCYDIGAFEGWGGMARWVMRYLPEWFFRGLGGKRLKERMGYWLAGRYGFAAGYVTELLVRGLRQPHRLLNEYIRQFTGFNPTDGHEAVAQEETESSERFKLKTWEPINFRRFEEHDDRMFTTHTILSHYIMRSTRPVPLGIHHQRLYVQYGLARFKNVGGDGGAESGTKNGTVSTCVDLDEPLVLAAAHCWFNDKKRERSYEYLANNIEAHLSATSSNGFENFIVYCIDVIFGMEGRKLKDVFQFHGDVPSWGNFKAELVSLYETGTAIECAKVGHGCFTGPSATLGTNAITAHSTLEWLKHRSRTPFCFPDNNMGPDVLFVLKLQNGKLLWVALQVKLSTIGRLLDKNAVQDAIRSVTPKNFFLNRDGKPFSDQNIVTNTLNQLEALPNKCQDAGRFSLLRVVASFPANVELERLIDKDEDKHHIGILNIELVKQVTRDKCPEDFLENWKQEKMPENRKRKRDPQESDVADSNRPGKRERRNIPDGTAGESSKNKRVRIRI